MLLNDIEKRNGYKMSEDIILNCTPDVISEFRNRTYTMATICLFLVYDVKYYLMISLLVKIDLFVYYIKYL